ncbi:MAG: response regulator [Polyangiaceae bacterium]
MTDPPTTILIVEDEASVRGFLRASLGSHGFHLLEAETARRAVQLVTTHQPDLIVLDLGLPDGDGVAMTRELRTWTRIPIIVISARGREEDKVLALDAGADDYVTKPFGALELLARIRVALRHARQPQLQTPGPALTVGPIRVDTVSRLVFLNEREIHLTPIEYNLLVLLIRNADKVLTHRQILKEVWGPAHASNSHYVRVYMAELRKKLEDDPANPRWLVTEPAVGYRLRTREAER